VESCGIPVDSCRNRWGTKKYCPKLAAITGFYMTYYNLLMLGGPGMVEQFEVLHKRYASFILAACEADYSASA